MTIPAQPAPAETQFDRNADAQASGQAQEADPDADAQTGVEWDTGGQCHRATFVRGSECAKRQALASIDATERGLKGINRSLDDTEQKTAAHIREFLKQARDALASGDVDGANTLAAKAKVLLAELHTKNSLWL